VRITVTCDTPRRFARSTAPASPTVSVSPRRRTARLRRRLLHDGSAATMEEAVRRHGAEALLARRGFERLGDADRSALLAFLRSL
jgi:di-heme oxidoreductase (putative peroxidase)